MTDYPYTYTLTPEPPEPSPEAMRQARREELIKNPDFTTHEDGWKLDVPPPKIWRREVYRWMPHLGGWVFRGVRG